MGHNGYTLVSTPPNVRPTVRDYHYSYTQGACSSGACCCVCCSMGAADSAGSLLALQCLCYWHNTVTC